MGHEDKPKQTPGGPLDARPDGSQEGADRNAGQPSYQQQGAGYGAQGRGYGGYPEEGSGGHPGSEPIQGDGSARARQVGHNDARRDSAEGRRADWGDQGGANPYSGWGQDGYTNQHGDPARGVHGRGNTYGGSGSLGPNERQAFDGDRGGYDGGRSIRSRRGPKGYTRSDERIREEVIDRLIQAVEIDLEHMEVAVEHAEVTLSGMVDSRRNKHRLEDLVDAVWGVKEIHNNLRVRAAGEENTSDRDRREASDKADHSNASTPPTDTFASPGSRREGSDHPGPTGGPTASR